MSWCSTWHVIMYILVFLTAFYLADILAFCLAFHRARASYLTYILKKYVTCQLRYIRTISDIYKGSIWHSGCSSLIWHLFSDINAQGCTKHLTYILALYLKFNLTIYLEVSPASSLAFYLTYIGPFYLAGFLVDCRGAWGHGGAERSWFTKLGWKL